MNKTPRKLIREAPGLVPDVLSKPSVIGGSSKDLFKGFIQRTETLSTEHKKLLANPVFSGCSPQIIDGVLFLEIYPCEIYNDSKFGLSNSDDVNVNNANDPSNAKFFKLGQNGTVTPQVKSANPFARIRNDSAFNSASPSQSRQNSRPSSPSAAVQYSGEVAMRTPSNTHVHNVRTHGTMERTLGHHMQHKNSGSAASSSRAASTSSTQQQQVHNIQRASSRPAHTDIFENGVLIINVFLLLCILFSFLLLLFVIACNVDQRFVSTSHRTVVYSALYEFQ